MWRRSVPVLAFLALAGCGSGSLEEWQGPPRAAPDGSLAVARFNDYLDDYEDYATSPEALATEFLQLEDTSAASVRLVTTRSGEDAVSATVDATLEGLLDDSIRSSRYVLRVDKRSGGWRLASASWSQQCRPGRGHQEFSPAACV